MSTSSQKKVEITVVVLVPIGAEEWAANHLQSTYDYALGRKEDAVALVKEEAQIVSQETKEDSSPADRHLNRKVRVRIRTR
jgi:hypothetical protein